MPSAHNRIGYLLLGIIIVCRKLTALLREAGPPTIRFHDLRHTIASALPVANFHLKKVQELLGHSQISVTLNIYSHVLPSLHDEVAEKLDHLLGATG